MPAITPHVPGHQQLPPMASRFVVADQLPWSSSEMHPGIQTKTLLIEPESGLLTMLLKMAPGAKLPDHEHVLIEQTWVLQGSLVCGEGECKAGEFVWRPAGSRHEAWGGPEGGLMLGIFQIPNRFFQADGKVVDFGGNAWEPIWGAALERQEQAKFA